MTSGGSESILISILAHRNWKRSQGITNPNLVLSKSAHPAFLKACDYFCIEPRLVNLNSKYSVETSSYKSRVDENTICVVVSCPNFPHGI